MVPGTGTVECAASLVGGELSHPPTRPRISSSEPIQLRVGFNYPTANANVARIGSFKTLHSAFRFASRGFVRPASQKYTHGPLTPTISATSRTDSPRLMRAS